MQVRTRTWPLAAFLLALAACATQEPPGASPEERIFHADPRWLGGDAAISVPLDEARTLWLFGDSFVDLAPPYRRSEAAFPRNTIAVQDGTELRRARMTFAWRAAAGQAASFFAEDGKAWFWPAGGVRLPDGTLALFLHRVLATTAAPPLGFAERGYAVILIANPDAPPDTWHMRRIDAPGSPADALPGPALLEGTHVVALAVRPGDHAATLVRYESADLAAGELGRAEWWSGPSRGWRKAGSLGAEGPAFILPDAGAESSLHWDDCARTFVQIASRGFGATDIVRRTAPALTGPWSAAQRIALPAESRGAQPFVYAAKAHPGLRGVRPHRLAVTYVASSFDPAALLTPAGERSLYWPRMIEVPAPACVPP
ncbi:MAG: hypothetical protein IT548_01220 [Alphaproteobacteria bacterium]|nr:hypothetical protein [Alphaproteobacteria bacterium]